MKTVCEKSKCTGCKACKAVCPVKAIHVSDELMEFNAYIDEAKCVSCGLCRDICQNNVPVPTQKPVCWYQGWSNDTEIRKYTSSGGLATSIEMAFVRNGGSVCSCVFESGEFVFKIINKESDIIKFAGSKYVKSNLDGIYGEIKSKLTLGENILFVGLPCQVAAIKNYLGNKLEHNLYTIDLICHGTPSFQILKSYLQQHAIDIYKLRDIKFRGKINFQLSADAKPIGVYGTLDKYLMSFLNGTIYTENCYDCSYARIDRVSDLTLGDSWGSTLSDEEKKRGISLVLCQSDKGHKLLEQANLHLVDVDIVQAINNNEQLSHPIDRTAKRKIFFKDYCEGKRFDVILWKCYPWICFKQLIKAILVKLNMDLGGVTNYGIVVYIENSQY